MDEIQRAKEIFEWFLVESEAKNKLMADIKYTISSSGEFINIVSEEIDPLKKIMYIYNSGYDMIHKYIDDKSDQIVETYNLYVLPLVNNAGKIVVEILKIDDGLYYRIEYIGPFKSILFPGKDSTKFFYEKFYDFTKKEYMDSIYPDAIWSIVYKLFKTILENNENTNT